MLNYAYDIQTNTNKLLYRIIITKRGKYCLKFNTKDETCAKKTIIGTKDITQSRALFYDYDTKRRVLII